jgi:hypothetical protein
VIHWYSQWSSDTLLQPGLHVWSTDPLSDPLILFGTWVTCEIHWYSQWSTHTLSKPGLHVSSTDILSDTLILSCNLGYMCHSPSGWNSQWSSDTLLQPVLHVSSTDTLSAYWDMPTWDYYRTQHGKPEPKLHVQWYLMLGQRVLCLEKTPPSTSNQGFQREKTPPSTSNQGFQRCM